MTNTLFLILTATGLAALIGLEREMRMQGSGQYGYFGGVRTFAMLGALGAISMLISENFAILVASMVFALITISHSITLFQNKKNGLATEFSGFASFLVGVLVMKNLVLPAVAIAILFTGILTLRQGLHQLAKNFEQEELFAILKFLIIAGVVLPLLPNYYLDQWEIFNPYHIWLMVIFVASIRFIAFFLGKVVGGKKSIVFTGLIGGLASSTAVTSTLSEESKKVPNNTAPFIAGILFANMLMFFKVILEVLVVNPEMVTTVFFPLAAMGLMAGGLGFFALFHRKKILNVKNEPTISQPFSLMEGLKFGAFFLFITAAVKIIPNFLGDVGLLTTAAISGLADTDAITLSVANLVKIGDVTVLTGTATILLAVIVNTLVKVVIIALFGSRELLRFSLVSFFLIFSVGVGILFLI